MAQDRLFAELCKPEALKIGWHLAQLDSRDDFVEDSLRHADFASQLEFRLDHLIELIANGRYRPRHMLDVDIPKSALTVRPGNILPIEEASILHAIIYLVAPKLDGELSDKVYSYRLHKDWVRRVRRGRSIFKDDELELPFLKRSTIKRFDPMESWYIAWPEFDAARKEALKDRRFTHVAKTDISAYFENVDLRLLEDIVKQRLRFEPKLLSLLFRILNAWTRDTAAGVSIGRGLPQGNDVSSFLANYYLLPLDRALDRFARQSGSTWFRYVDDLDILTDSYDSARDAVLLVNQVLRSLHLNLQGSKTRILSGKELREEYSHIDSDRVGELIEQLSDPSKPKACSSRQRKSIIADANKISKRFTRGLPDSIRSLGAKDNRLLRRLYTFYGTAQSPRLRRCAFACLRDQPERRLLEKSLRYLRGLDYRHHDEVAAELLEMASSDKKMTDFQLALTIQTIGLLHPKNPQKLASAIRQLALTSRREWLVTQKALEALFSLPYRSSSAEKVATRYLGDRHPWIRRAAVLLILKSDRAFALETMGKLVFHPDTALLLPALMWKRFEEDRPFRDAKLRRMESVDHDHAFVRNLQTMWALTNLCDQSETDRLVTLLSPFLKSKSAVVLWHAGEMIKRIGEATQRADDSVPARTAEDRGGTT